MMPVPTRSATSSKAADRQLATALVEWFAASARDLPWRRRTTNATPSGRDPYHALVAEVMLQQTQVSRVLEKYEPFLAAFPTVRALAEADESQVLAHWSGLGYYRRGRNLHACARAIVDRHDGVVPSDASELATLPGIGRYTAGAISSIVFGRPEPIVDGNITRVLLRIDGVDHAHGSTEAADHAWDRAAELVAATDDPAQLNESLMELGATVCTPKNVRCDACPVRARCAAARTNRQLLIPRPKIRAPRQPLFAWTMHIHAGDQILLRRRPDTGLWAGLWELPTVETTNDAEPAEIADIADAARVEPKPGPAFRFATTHRDVRFQVTEIGPVGSRRAKAVAARFEDAEWVDRGEALARGLSNPQRRLIEAGVGEHLL
jgi:A/G-specific adenine glycosylase